MSRTRPTFPNCGETVPSVNRRLADFIEQPGQLIYDDDVEHEAEKLEDLTFELEKHKETVEGAD